MYGFLTSSTTAWLRDNYFSFTSEALGFYFVILFPEKRSLILILFF